MVVVICPTVYKTFLPEYLVGIRNLSYQTELTVFPKGELIPYIFLLTIVKL